LLPFIMREAERRTAHPSPIAEASMCRPQPRSFATARLPALHRGRAPGLSIPNSARAALPGITGSKREDPLRHQCSEHLAVRSRAGRDDAQTACEQKVTNSARKNRTRSVSPRLRLTSLTMSGMAVIRKIRQTPSRIFSGLCFSQKKQTFICRARGAHHPPKPARWKRKIRKTIRSVLACFRAQGVYS
jgi:hypothetical protein